MLLIAALIGWRAVAPPSEPALTGVDVASACSGVDFATMSRLQGKSVLASPLVSMQLLGQPSAPDLVAIPFHSVGHGMERVYRFFDPATPDPQTYLSESGADYVAVCRFDAPPAIVAKFPFASALAGGDPPSWLRECDVGGGSLRVYAAASSSDKCTFN